MANSVRFVRVRGRVVPIRDNGATQGSKRRYPAIKPLGGKAVAVASAVTAAAGAVLFKSKFGAFASGLAGGLTAASVRVTKRAKGESNKHVVLRIARRDLSRKTK